MRNELQIFNSPEFGQVRSIMIDDEPWFVGKDVADALGYQNGRGALSRHVDLEDKNTVVIPDGNKGNPNQTIINESGLYSLILSSKLPNAKKFKRWVTSEVLPALRKTGSYSIAPEVPERKLTADDYLRAASIISTCKNERLPYVLDLLKKSGIKIPKLQSEQPKSIAGRDVEGRARKAIGTAKLVYGITYAEISRKSGVTRQQIGRIYSGESVPTLERSEVVCGAIHDLIVKTTA